MTHAIVVRSLAVLHGHISLSPPSMPSAACVYSSQCCMLLWYTSVIQALNHAHVLTAEKLLGQASANSSSGSNAGLGAVSTQIRVLGLTSNNALRVRNAHPSRRVPLAYVMNALPGDTL